jgi:hypothetical protein
MQGRRTNKKTSLAPAGQNFQGNDHLKTAFAVEDINSPGNNY